MGLKNNKSYLVLIKIRAINTNVQNKHLFLFSLQDGVAACIPAAKRDQNAVLPCIPFYHYDSNHTEYFNTSCKLF